jgi:hypothetical protein
VDINKVVIDYLATIIMCRDLNVGSLEEAKFLLSENLTYSNDWTLGEAHGGFNEATYMLDIISFTLENHVDWFKVFQAVKAECSWITWDGSDINPVNNCD